MYEIFVMEYRGQNTLLNVIGNFYVFIDFRNRQRNT